MFVPGAVFTIRLQDKIKEKLKEDAIYFPEVLGKNLKAAHPTLLDKYISSGRYLCSWRYFDQKPLTSYIEPLNSRLELDSCNK